MAAKKSKKGAKRKAQPRTKAKPPQQTFGENEQGVKNRSRRNVVYAVRIHITPTGHRRTEAQLRADVAEALAAARKNFTPATNDENVDASIESEGGYLGLGVDWPWLFAALEPLARDAGLAVLAGAAKELAEQAGKKLMELFFKELRNRHLSPGAPTPAPEITSVLVPTPNKPAKQRKQSSNKQGRKSRKK